MRGNAYRIVLGAVILLLFNPTVVSSAPLEKNQKHHLSYITQSALPLNQSPHQTSHLQSIL